MVRYLILAACLAYFALLAVLAVEVRRAAPGPAGQAIAGVGIGSHWGGLPALWWPRSRSARD